MRSPMRGSRIDGWAHDVTLRQIDSLARPWRPQDGDTRCQECGSRNPVWWANNDDWNRLLPDDGVLCPSCYHAKWLAHESTEQ